MAQSVIPEFHTRRILSSMKMTFEAGGDAGAEKAFC